MTHPEYTYEIIMSKLHLGEMLTEKEMLLLLKIVQHYKEGDFDPEKENHNGN